MRNYLDITGDAAGVVGSAPEITGKCWESYFWYAPGCRSQPANCLTWFTGGTGWGMFEMLVKATMYNMPLATAVAYSFADYARLPTTNDVMWEPKFFASFKSLVLYLSQQGKPEIEFFHVFPSGAVLFIFLIRGVGGVAHGTHMNSSRAQWLGSIGGFQIQLF